MSLKYLLIVTLTVVTTAACASVPEAPQGADLKAGSVCETKPDRAVASCGVQPTADEASKASEESAPSRISAREPFHHRGRMGD